MFPDWLTQFELWWLWQYWLWSFQTWDTNLERFLPKTQHTLKVKFWQLWQLLIQNSKFNHFVWVCWFLNKNLSNLTTRIAIMMMSSQALNEGRKTQTWLCYCFCGSRKTLTKKKKNFCLLTLYLLLLHFDGIFAGTAMVSSWICPIELDMKALLWTSLP